MRCVYCGSSKTDVYNSRNTDEKSRVWRRRRCRECQRAFTTYESSDLGFLTIIKNDGQQEAYQRSKLLISLYFACQGLSQPIEAIDALVHTVENRLLQLNTQEIKSQDIAYCVLEVLKRFHASPYVRYLSYRGDIVSDTHLRELAKNI